jgi:hypothetical protein
MYFSLKIASRIHVPKCKKSKTVQGMQHCLGDWHCSTRLSIFSIVTFMFQRACFHRKHLLSGQLLLFFISAYSSYVVVITQRHPRDFSAWLISSKSTYTFSIFHAWEMCKTIKVFGHLRRLSQQRISVLSNLQVKLNFNLNK